MNNIEKTLADLDGKGVMRIVKRKLYEDAAPVAILEECRLGMENVGEKFEAKEYFLSELLLSAEIFKKIMTLLKPYLKPREVACEGIVVVGTVKGDMHDIGKNIVATMLSCMGFQVLDLGVDVGPKEFVQKIKKHHATILGLSCLLTSSFEPMKETIQAMAKANLRQKVKVMIGGGPVNRDVMKLVQADGYGKDVRAALALAKRWAG